MTKLNGVDIQSIFLFFLLSISYSLLVIDAINTSSPTVGRTAIVNTALVTEPPQSQSQPQFIRRKSSSGLLAGKRAVIFTMDSIESYEQNSLVGGAAGMTIQIGFIGTFVCMYVCIYVCMYLLCMYVCMYLCVYICVCMYVRMCVCMYVCIQ